MAHADPITVAIERQIDPTRTIEATSWMQAGVDLAAGFDGFLGSGWVRAGAESELWYMLYRFTDLTTLEAWEQSSQRNWWLDSGRAFAKEVRTERRTGIEGWFDAPLGITVNDPATGPIAQIIPPAPPRWKQAISIWLGFFPVNLLFSWAVGFVPGFELLPMPVRVLISTLVLTPIMAYWVLPWVTRMLRPWLHRG
ncbi:antibiotic biosynthesis monooxygenase [Microbacterium sp. NC79]|uniref:antibiotic biosynthesis monooxygenase n=1 Tax=Microbacterium sp. NC79 TaxID=2851009 RepID=UPI001C2C74F6|nr:antibiotic biosynthesis monooxygenase [Microbacterium sp. NC79]MBV0893771.1 antibiotic biosynthesis monooxygenase [Microbacterium sp. NC79]